MSNKHWFWSRLYSVRHDHKFTREGAVRLHRCIVLVQMSLTSLMSISWLNADNSNECLIALFSHVYLSFALTLCVSVSVSARERYRKRGKDKQRGSHRENERETESDMTELCNMRSWFLKSSRDGNSAPQVHKRVYGAIA